MIMTPTVRQRASEFWSARSQRERLFLVVWGLVLSIASFVLIFISPAIEGIARLNASQAATRDRTTQIRALAQEARELRQLPQVGIGNSSEILAALGKTDHAFTADPPAVLPNGDFRVSFHQANYGNWAAWLAETEHNLGLRAIQVHVQAVSPSGSARVGQNAAPGVDIDVVLRPVNSTN
jgi:general secretion pathway protein M